MLSGCGMALKTMDSASTTGLIQEAGPSLKLENQVVELTAHLETPQQPDGTGVMVLKLTSTGGGEWPPGYRLSSIGFRPQSASYYFNYIDLDPWGNPTRITRQSALSLQIEKGSSSLEARFRILRLVANKPYEVLVTLRDATGKVHRLGVRSIGRD